MAQQQHASFMLLIAAVVVVSVVQAQLCFNGMHDTTSLTDEINGPMVNRTRVILSYTHITPSGEQWPMRFQDVMYKTSLFPACYDAMRNVTQDSGYYAQGQLLESTEIRQMTDNTIIISRAMKCVPSTPDVCGFGELRLALNARYSLQTSGAADAPEHNMKFRGTSLFSFQDPRMPHITALAGDILPMCAAMTQFYNQTGAINDNSPTGGMLMWADPTDQTRETIIVYQHLQEPGTGVVLPPWDWNSTCKSWGGSVVELRFIATMANGTRMMSARHQPHFHCFPVTCSHMAIQAELERHARHLIHNGEFVTFDGWAFSPLLGMNFSFALNTKRNDTCGMQLFHWRYADNGVNNYTTLEHFLAPEAQWPSQTVNMYNVTLQNVTAQWTNLGGWEDLCFKAGGVPANRGHFNMIKDVMTLVNGLEMCMPTNCDQVSVESFLQDLSDEFVRKRGASFGADFIFPHRQYAREFHVTAFASGGEDCLDRLVTMHWTNTSVNSGHAQPHTESIVNIPPALDETRFVNITWTPTDPAAFKDLCWVSGGQPIDVGGASLNYSNIITAFHGRKLCVPDVCRMHGRLHLQVQDYMKIIANDAVTQYDARYQDMVAEGPAPFYFMVDNGAHDRDRMCFEMHRIYEMKSGAGADFKYYVNDDTQRGSFQTVATKNFDMTGVAMSVVTWTDFNSWVRNCLDMLGWPAPYSYAGMADSNRLVTGMLGQYSCIPRFCEQEYVNTMAEDMLERHVFVNNTVYGESHLGDSDVATYNFSNSVCLQTMMNWTFDGPNSAQNFVKYRGSDLTCSAPVGGVSMCKYVWKDYTTWEKTCTMGSPKFGSVVKISVLLTEPSGAAMNITDDFDCVPDLCRYDAEQVYLYVKMRAMGHMRRDHKYSKVDIQYGPLTVTVPDERCRQQFEKFNTTVNNDATRGKYFSPPEYKEMPIGPFGERNKDLAGLKMNEAFFLRPEAYDQYASECANAGGMLMNYHDTKVWGAGNYSRFTLEDMFCVPAVCFADDLKEGIGRSVWRALQADKRLLMVKRTLGEAYQALGQEAQTCARQFNMFTDMSLNIDFLGKYHDRHLARDACMPFSSRTEVCFDQFTERGRFEWERDCTSHYGMPMESSVTMTMRVEGVAPRNMVWNNVPLCVPAACYWASATDGSVQTAVQKFAEQFAAWYDVSAVSITVNGDQFFNGREFTVDFDAAHVYRRNPACLYLMTQMGQSLTRFRPNGTNSEQGKSELSYLECEKSGARRRCRRVWANLDMYAKLCSSDTAGGGALINFEHRHRFMDGVEVFVTNDYMCVPRNCSFAALSTETLTDYLQFTADEHVSVGDHEGHVAEEVDLMLWAPGTMNIMVHSSCHDFGTCPYPSGSESKSKAWIAGAVIGAIAGAGLIGYLVYFVLTHGKYGSSSSGDVDLKSAKMVKPQI